MIARAMDIPEEVRRRVRNQGVEGAAWVAGLLEFIAALESDWGITVGATMRGGSAALVLEAETSGGEAVVLKLPIPWLETASREVRVLLTADGRGYARVLRHHEASGAILLERLGSALETLRLSVPAQIEALCATLLQAWIRPADPGPFLSGDRKAIELAAFIEATWRELGQPCPEHVIEVALAYAADRRKAFDPDRAVLAHGDAHPGNLLVAGSQGKRRTFKFVDPEGLFVEPAYDLSAVMREWGAELLAGDPLELGLRRCHLVARRTELAPEPIWQWGFIERVSTGLHLRQLGWDELSREYLAVAEAWAAPQGHAPHRSASRGWPDRSSG